MEESITVGELASHIGVSDETIRRDIYRGLLIAHKHIGIQGYRIKTSGANGVHHYIRHKFPKTSPYKTSK
jgi:excisionase family DNA binding protein